MNVTLELAYSWFGNFVEAFLALTNDVAQLVASSLSLSPNASSSSDSETTDEGSALVSEETPADSPAVLAGEKVLSSIPQLVQDLANYFAFDDFQYQLLKVFIAILVVQAILIYIAWYFYGERISEHFLSDSPNIPPEELKRRITELNLPRVHSQRY